MMDHLEDSYGGIRKNQPLDSSLCLKAPAGELLIDDIDAKELRIFDSNPDASYDVRTLTTDLNLSGAPTPMTKLSQQALSQDQTEQKTTEPFSSSAMLLDSEMTEDMWLQSEPRGENLINKLQDNENTLSLVQAKDIQNAQYAFQLRITNEESSDSLIWHTPQKRKLRELGLNEIERLAPTAIKTSRTQSSVKQEIKEFAVPEPFISRGMILNFKVRSER